MLPQKGDKNQLSAVQFTDIVTGRHTETPNQTYSTHSISCKLVCICVKITSTETEEHTKTEEDSLPVIIKDHHHKAR